MQTLFALAPDWIRRLAAHDGDLVEIEGPQALKLHESEAGRGSETVGVVVSQYEAGESATSIAKNLSVAPSTLLRLLVRKGVVAQSTYSRPSKMPPLRGSMRPVPR